MTEPITFQAQVARIQTLADGGLRLVLDLQESAILAVAQLLECKRIGVAGDVTYTPMVDGDNAPQEWSPE